MKAFKIKKRSHRQATFIIGPSVTSFPKPKLPLLFFVKIHSPGLFKQFTWVVQEESGQALRPESLPVLGLSRQRQDLVVQLVNLGQQYPLPEAAS